MCCKCTLMRLRCNLNSLHLWCEAVPHARQVMGAYLSSLRGREREQQLWRDALNMLQSAEDMPEGEERLFASLRISYTALKSDQRRMFLDAAFFFLGRRVDTALPAWER